MITRWRFGQVASVLLPGGEQCEPWNWKPPTDWSCWDEPSPALPIDWVLTRLRHSNRPPQLRPRDELDTRGLPCPYYAARFAIALAVDAATMAAADDAAEMARRWRAHEHAASKARAGIKTIAESLTRAASETPFTRWPLVESPEVRAAYKLIFALHQIGGLDRIEEHARRSRQVFQRDQGDVWRAVFAAELGFFWRVLTDSPPARTTPFIDFITAAYESLMDDPPSVSWERPVRRALAMGLDWDRFEKR
jgi:hypothetical protein